MNKEEFGRMLAEAKDLPLLPQVVILVQKTIDEEGSSASDLSKIITNDQVLTSRLLRMANSSFYRFSHNPISTVTDAIVLLGFETVKNITLSLSIYKLMSSLNKDDSFKFFWRHSLCCAMAAQSLADEKNAKNKEAAFVAGLMHDLGKVILTHYFPKHYKKVLNKMAENPQRKCSIIESEIIGINHKEAGAILADYWNLPLDVAQPMQYHDDRKLPPEEKETSPFHHIVYLANRISSNIYGSDIEKQLYTFSVLSNDSKRLLKIGSDSLFKIISRLSEQVYETAKVLDIAIDDIKISDKDNTSLEGDKVNLLSKKLHRRESELELLMNINDAILTAKNIQQILTVANNGITKLCSPKRLIYAFVDGATNTLKAKMGHGDVNRVLLDSIKVDMSNVDDIMVRCINENIHINTSQFSEQILIHLPEQFIFEVLDTHRICIYPLKLTKNIRGVMIYEPTKNENIDELSETFLTTFSNSLAIGFSKFS